MTTLKARLIGLTQPVAGSAIPSSEDIVSYCARVSNPSNQENFDTSEKLLKYCIANKHWSVFEMVSATVEVEAPRDISRQLLRHRSFSFQEFSQRYSDEIEFTEREVRLQDLKNRQNSVPVQDLELRGEWSEGVESFVDAVGTLYFKLRNVDVAKECARVILPEGLTMSRLYVNGTLRSWIHYLDVREGNGTQLEHQILATKIKEALLPVFPITFSLVNNV